MINRYSRQIIFPPIGEKGQERIGRSSVVVIGCGALGTVICSALARAGVGKLKIIDRDFIEYHNLQRQLLFNEDDIVEGLPKALAAERHLRKINSEISIEGIIADVNYTNIERFIEGADVILDGLDNTESRFLINDAALKHGIPWVYGGAIASTGMTMTIIPGQTPCFRCITAGPAGAGTTLTCDTGGVISPAPWIVASLQVAEALKIVIGAKNINPDLLFMDVWETRFRNFKITRRKDCPACQGKYDFLNGNIGVKTTSLCGQNSVQVSNIGTGKLSFESMAQRLKALGKVNYNDFMLTFSDGSQEMVVFPDGRAIVKNTNDESLARGFYSKYIGA
jgi:molybdopterin/thiamine biosynthesis adenylyltransferase